jgi:hypothetical protein
VQARPEQLYKVMRDVAQAFIWVISGVDFRFAVGVARTCGSQQVASGAAAAAALRVALVAGSSLAVFPEFVL